MTHKFIHALLFSALVCVAGEAAAAGGTIKFAEQELYPEGVAFDAKAGQFLVSSMRHGKIGRVDRDGTYHPFIEDGVLVSSVGLRIDPVKNRLLVAISDPGVAVGTNKDTQAKLAGLAVFDLKSAKRLAYYDFGKLSEGAHFANDIALDDRGNIYVTDSFSPIVYKIGKAGKPSIFVRNELFKGDGFNLNGVVFHPKGYLIVGKSNSGELFKISMSGSVSKIALQQSLTNNDGLVLSPDGSLAVIQNSGEVSRLVSSDNWASAKMAGSSKPGLEFPTTGVLVGNSLYVLNAKLGELFDPKVQKSSDFSIRSVSFESSSL